MRHLKDRSVPLVLVDSKPIQTEDVDIVDSSRHLGLHIDNKLDWSDHTHAVFKEAQGRQLFSPGGFVCNKLQEVIYPSEE